MQSNDYYKTGYVVVAINQRKWFGTVMGTIAYCSFLKKNSLEFKVIDCENDGDITEEVTKDCV